MKLDKLAYRYKFVAFYPVILLDYVALVLEKKRISALGLHIECWAGYLKNRTLNFTDILLLGIPWAIDVFFQVCPCWGPLSVAAISNGMYVISKLLVISSYYAWFIFVCLRAPRLEKVECQWVCFGGYQKDSLKQYQHCKVRFVGISYDVCSFVL